MIIKTFGQLGKCIDDGVEMEFECWEVGGDRGEGTHFEALRPSLYGFATLQDLLEEGRIRTKPKTVDVRMYFDDDDEPCQVDLADVDDSGGRRSRIFTLTLSDDE